jgi:hypothetical protein
VLDCTNTAETAVAHEKPQLRKGIVRAAETAYAVRR